MALLRKILTNEKITSENIYRFYLKIVAVFLPYGLTEGEVDILVYIFNSGNMLSTNLRKTIREKIGISEKNFNNFISKLGKKGILEDHHGFKTISKRFLIPRNENEITLVINLNKDVPDTVENAG